MLSLGDYSALIIRDANDAWQQQHQTKAAAALTYPREGVCDIRVDTHSRAASGVIRVCVARLAVKGLTF